MVGSELWFQLGWEIKLMRARRIASLFLYIDGLAVFAYTDGLAVFAGGLTKSLFRLILIAYKFKRANLWKPWK